MIKKWIEFIKESKKENSIWKLTQEDVNLYLIDLIDLRYKIELKLGKVDDNGSFSTDITTGYINPAYWLYIDTYNVKSNDDVTDSLLTICDYLETKGFDITAMDNDGEIDLNYIKIKRGIDYFKDGIELEGDFGIFIKQLDNQTSLFKDSRKLEEYYITEIDLAKYYKWKGYEIINNHIYVSVDLDTIARYILSSRGYDKITNGINEEDYYNYSEKPDVESLFSYYLDKDNEKVLLKVLIDEIGLEDVIEINNKLEGMSEDEVIEFILGERNYYTLKELCFYNDNDVLDEVRQIYSDMETSSHIGKNTQELYDAFDNTISDYFEYTKLTKDYVTYYKIKFDEKWIEDRDYDFLENLSLNELLQEYCSVEGFGDDLDPNFSDYGSVDLNEFNKEVKSILK
jgi:hypothetical protein